MRLLLKAKELLRILFGDLKKLSIFPLFSPVKREIFRLF
jgi:hypothetical protein